MHKIIVNDLDSGKKIFRFLKKLLPYSKNSDIFKMLRKKIVSVNGKKVDDKYVINTGDEIILYVDKKHLKKIKISIYAKKPVNLNIIFEDENIIAINKEAGKLVHGSIAKFDKEQNNKTLLADIENYLSIDRSNLGYFKPAACNRLDRNTTGVVVFAKNHRTLKDITKKFRERGTQKKYLALIFGKLEKNLFITSGFCINENSENTVIPIDVSVTKNIPDKKTFVDKHYDISATSVTVLKAGEKISLVEVDLWTGKKHQIRAHLSAAGYPIIGDNKYGNKKSITYFKNNFKINHLFLHAYLLSIEEYEQMTADLPDYFIEIAEKKLGFNLSLLQK